MGGIQRKRPDRGSKITGAAPNRIHLLAHANPAGRDLPRFELAGLDEYFALIRSQLPAGIKLTANRRIFEAVEDPDRGGRDDDGLRIRDVQDALNDPNTLAVVAVSGGAYFTRILPHLDFSVLNRRPAPLWALGFSEMTSLVNLVATYRMGRGVYWLCPNYLAWKIRPAQRARAAFAEFWRRLPDWLASGFRDPPEPRGTLLPPTGVIHAEVVRGRPAPGKARLIGGCLSVLGPLLMGPVGRRLKPDGRWLLLEDVNEAPYRVDRHLAGLKIAGWFERIAGVLVADFHTQGEPQSRIVVELLERHLPAKTRMPVAFTSEVGHVWPMVPALLNRSLALRVEGNSATFNA